MKKATDVFGEWAKKGKDVGMEKTHAIPVNEMIDFALEERANLGKNFSFLDLGCGSGIIGISIAKETKNTNYFSDISKVACKNTIKNLNLCSPGTHPGGGLTAINGTNAARKIKGEKK